MGIGATNIIIEFYGKAIETFCRLKIIVIMFHVSIFFFKIKFPFDICVCNGTAIQEVPDPVVINLPEFAVKEGIDEFQVTTLNEWLSSLAKGVSFANALVSAINRAQGAEVAGDSEARERQLAAARDFANQWADTLVEAAGLRSIVAVALSNLKIETISISQSELWEIQSEILASGWTKEIIDTLAHFKISDEDQSRILRKATAGLNDITEVTASLVDNLNDPDFTSQESEVIAVLKEFAMAL